MRWAKCLSQIKKLSPPETAAVVGAGLQTVMGHNHPTEQTITEWPRHLQEKYQRQDQIGWTHMFQGRLAKCWNQYPSENGDTSLTETTGWTNKVIVLLWNFGLDLWKLRNQLIHGEGQISDTAKARVGKMVQAVYENICTVKIETDTEWL